MRLLKGLETESQSASYKLNELFLGICSWKMKHMKSRAKEEGKRKAQRRKEKQQEEGTNKLLIKLFKEDMEEKALYNTEDLDENPKVTPKMDLQYYNILLEHGIFLE